MRLVFWCLGVGGLMRFCTVAGASFSSCGGGDGRRRRLAHFGGFFFSYCLALLLF